MLYILWIQNIICCTTQTGAIKRTTESTEFMHVQCAIYNKEIDHTKYPYLVDKSKLGQLVSEIFMDYNYVCLPWSQRCALCLQQQGICARCEEPGCPKSVFQLRFKMEKMRFIRDFIQVFPRNLRYQRWIDTAQPNSTTKSFIPLWSTLEQRRSFSRPSKTRQPDLSVTSIL